MVSHAFQLELPSTSKIISFPSLQKKQISYTSVLDASALVSEDGEDQIENNLQQVAVKLSEIFDRDFRLDAHYIIADKFGNLEFEDLAKSEFNAKPLYGEIGFCKEAFCPPRLRHIFVDNSEQGIPFLSSAEVIELKPESTRYLKRSPKLRSLSVNQWDILIPRSGIIGSIALASASYLGQAISEDVIRVRLEDPDTAGFIAAFLRSCYGRPQLNQATRGSSVTCLDIENLEEILIPDLPPIRRIAIGQLMRKACELRDEANRLLDQADCLLHKLLKLPYLKRIASSGEASFVAKVKASELMERLEGSFHNPIARAAEKQLKQLPIEVTTVGDPRITKEVRAITRFRKRTYVERGGTPLLSSKQLFQIDPIDVKRLAKGAHEKDLDEIQLKENMIAVTCSGTIGRIQIIPAYMASWTANQHANRLLAADSMNPGYLYAWLASDYGYSLITRHAYGSVILELDRFMLSSVPIPFPEASIRDEIGNLVLKANQLRDKAWRNEQEAIGKLENLISKKPSSLAVVEPVQPPSSLGTLTFDPTATPIWELAAQLSSQVSEEDWEQLPTDLAKRFDDYQKQRQGQD